MKFHGSSAFFALAVPVLATGTAEAQPAISRDLPFTTIAVAPSAPIGAMTKVIESAQDYKATLGVDAPASIDFAREVVLLASMGPKTTGGYSIEIKRIQHMLIGITGGMAFVSVEERSPAPGAFVTFALTNPVHIVKVERGPTRFLFQSATPAPATSFSKIELRTNNASGQWWSNLSIDASGNFHYDLAGLAIFPAPPIDAQVTPEELADVKRLFLAADVASLPTQVPSPPIAGGTNITLKSTIGTKTHSFSAAEGFLGQYGARVKPLLEKLHQIRERLSKPQASFKTISLKIQPGFFPGGPPSVTSDLSVDETGKARLLRSSPVAKYAPVDGRATAAELQALKDAFLAADVHSLNGKNVSPEIPDAPTFKVSAVVGADALAFDGYTPSIASQFQARVEPLMDALKAIQRRLMSPAPAAAFEELKFTSGGGFAPSYTVVTLKPNGDAVAEKKFKTIGPQNLTINGRATPAELAAVKAAFDAADVTTLPDRIVDPNPPTDVGSYTLESRVFGVAYKTVTRQGYYGDHEARLRPVLESLAKIRDRLLTEGQVKDLYGRVEILSDGSVRIAENKSSNWTVTNEPFKSILRSLVGQFVSARAQCHPVMFGGTCEVLSLKGVADKNLNVRERPTSLSKRIGRVDKGDKVVVTGRGNAYYYEVLINGTQKGFVLRSGIDIGSPTYNPPAATPGITGTVPN